MASILIEDMDPRAQPTIREHVRRCNEIEPIRIICTLRLPPEQLDAFLRGTSKTKTKSLHLPQKCCGLAHAIDICPVRLLTQKNWAPKDPVWEKMRVIGRSLGLVCNIAWDKPHYEWHPELA